MALAPGEARKDLSADALFGSLRSRFASLPDPRSGEVEIPLDDALMSAFAMFSLKDPSLLAFDDRRRDHDNFRTIYGINRVPCDSQMRAVLDPVDPAGLRAPYREIFPSPATRQGTQTFRVSGRPLLGVAGQAGPIFPPPRSTAPRAWSRLGIATATSPIPMGVTTAFHLPSDGACTGFSML